MEVRLDGLALPVANKIVLPEGSARAWVFACLQYALGMRRPSIYSNDRAGWATPIEGARLHPISPAPGRMD